MKKKIIIAISSVVVMLIAGLVIWINDTNKKAEDFFAFRELLDEDFFPILRDSGDYFDTLIERENDIGIYFVEDGYEVNLKLKSRLKEVKDVVIKTDVKYEDTHALKKNVLTTISEMEDLLGSLYTMSPSQYDFEARKIFYDLLGRGTEGLSKQVREMNEILGEYYK
ncbi:hypothetical protein JSQ81_16005 [Sporosarcina sp. Marseille-Q4063]|uniref:hypothetical protein n=1 Tax=Sporosarcina sp. Marseille-Q4063 TaxID=2810514 RepID=UPI001BAFE1A4|nr:hypothetical protein [Sporosarcina sp. Marseille-Q4063]QUW21294.1 hypothetical protein JSQ81_16005 [Sporosarcina sp. Marseille-Q4063]